MGRVKYLCKKVFSWNYKDAIKQSKILSKKYNQNSFFIFMDMIGCGIKYGAGYVDYVEFEFNLLDRKQRKTYLTSEINNRIVKKYNNKEYMHIFSDKITFNKIFKEYIKRDYISIRNDDSSFDEFVKFCKHNKKIVVKVADATHGLGIDFYEINSKNDFNALYQKLLYNKQYLIEEYIEQHPDLTRLYNGSVNSLRVITFLKGNGEVVILRAVLKIGNREGIDNCRNGGMYTFLDENGKVIMPAFDENNIIYEVHPKSGEKIVGFQVPHYQEIKDLVENASKVVPQIRYIGWDIAIKKNGPIIIEGNEYSGIFQMKASINPTKNGELANFRKYMDI